MAEKKCWKVAVLDFAGTARFLLTITEFSKIRSDISTNPNTKYIKVYDSDCFYSCLISTQTNWTDFTQSGLTLTEAPSSRWIRTLRAIYTLTYTERFYFVKSYLIEKLSKLRSFHRQQRRSQKRPFQQSFIQRTAQFSQGIPRFPQFTCFIHHRHTHKKIHRTDHKKANKPDGKPVLCQRTFSSVFRAVFLHS